MSINYGTGSANKMRNYKSVWDELSNVVLVGALQDVLRYHHKMGSKETEFLSVDAVKWVTLFVQHNEIEIDLTRFTSRGIGRRFTGLGITPFKNSCNRNVFKLDEHFCNTLRSKLILENTDIRYNKDWLKYVEGEISND